MSREVTRYDPINSDGTCGECVEDADYGAYVEYADYAALAAELDRLLEGRVLDAETISTLEQELKQSRDAYQNIIDQTTPLEPVPGDPRWSKRIELDEVIAERDQLRAELVAIKGQQVGQEPVAVIAFYEGSDTPVLIGWERMPVGQHNLYTAPQPAPAQDVAGWIPVTERLPEVAQEVIVSTEFEGVCAGILDSYGEWFAPCSEYKLTRVTHWMPLPAAPAHDKQSGEVRL